MIPWINQIGELNLRPESVLTANKLQKKKKNLSGIAFMRYIVDAFPYVLQAGLKILL